MTSKNLYTENGPNVNNVRKIYIPEAVNRTQLKIRFRIEANYYYWIIDDVYVTEREAYNLKLNNSFAIAPNTEFPRTQGFGFGGMVSAENIGSKTAKNVKIKLVISDYKYKPIWSDSLYYGDMAPGFKGNIILNGEYSPSLNDKTYYPTGIYTIEQDSVDFDSTDNQQSFSWSESNDYLSKGEFNLERQGLRPPSNVNFTWGNIYHIVNNKYSTTGFNYNFKSVQFGITNSDQLAGAEIFAWVYKWNNLNKDSIIQEDEKTTVGFGKLIFSAGEAEKTIFKIPLYNYISLEDGCPLESNTDYIIALQYSAPSFNPNLECLIMYDPEVNYDFNYLRELSKTPDNIHYNHVLDVGNTGIFNTKSILKGEVPVIRTELGIDTISAFKSFVNGKIYVDFNCDTLINGNDQRVSFNSIYDTQNNFPISTSNYFGTYIMELKEKDSLKYSVVPLPGFTIHPVKYTIINDVLGSKFTDYDFRMCPDSNFHNVKVNIVALQSPEPGFIHKYKICYENLGTQLENVTITFNFSGGQGDAFTEIINSDGGFVNGHTITWNITDLELFHENCRVISLQVDPKVGIGTQLFPHITIDLSQGYYDINTSDNDERLNEKVVASHDPNDKNVSKEGFTSLELEKGVSLDYQIRFQNTGNYPATFIDVYDTLVNTLDIRTFEMISASHSYTLSFPSDHVLKWRFDNIKLADSTSNEPGSHGYIKFRIRTMPNLKMSDVISNSAGIYFDFNAPVITNSITTSFLIATKNVLINTLPIEVYPNPVSNIAQVKYSLSEKTNCILELIDPTGKIILNKGAERQNGEQKDFIDMTDYVSGVYYLKIYTEKGMAETKIVKK